MIKMPKGRIKIGFLDSGIGGLSVLKAVLSSSIDCECVYLADTQNFPYGNQSKEEIIQHCYRNILFLQEQGVDLIFIACHTASAIALPVIRKFCTIPCVSMISLSVKKTLLSTKTNIVGMMGTPATISSLAYNRMFKRENNQIKLFSKSFSSLATLIEKEFIDTSVLYDTIKDCFDRFFFKGMDVIILGCTHFVILKHLIRLAVGENVTLVDPALEVVSFLNKQWLCLSLLPARRSPKNLTIYVTRYVRSFEKNTFLFLKKCDVVINLRTICLESKVCLPMS